MPKNPTEKYCCSFCGKGQDEVRKLIAGPNKVFICDECVDLCADIIEEELEEEPVETSEGSPDINLLKPGRVDAPSCTRP